MEDGPDIALVIPLDGDRVHLVEQHRRPIGRRCWEFPSGSHDPGELESTVVAARELREETGLRAGTLVVLGVVDVLPSTTAQRCSVFLATDLTVGESERGPGEQDMVSAWFTRHELEQMIAAGTFADAKSLAAYALLLTR